MISRSAAFVATLIFISTGVPAGAQDNAKIERGAHLAMVSGCHDCHSPKVFSPEGMMDLDKTRLLSGHPASELPSFTADMVKPGGWILFTQDLTAAVGPWGTSYAANLTPDDQTGIGLWTEENFVQAIRSGKHMGNGRPILPPMPWPMFANMTDEELSALFAYLKSLPPIKNAVPAPAPPMQPGK